MEEAPALQEDVTTYTIHKQTYSDGQAYRYHVSDEADHLRYVAERTGMQLPSPTRLVEFFNPEQELSGRLQPPDIAPWLRGTRYEIFAGEETEEPYATIQERWGLVDILLLRLPRYEVQLGRHRYVVQGSRYGAHFYEIFRPCEEEEAKEEEEEEEEAVEIEEEEEAAEAEEEGAIEAEEEEAVEAEEPEISEIEDDEEAKPKEVPVGRILRPTAGPSYTVEIDAAPLRQALLVLAALVILIDMELYS